MFLKTDVCTIVVLVLVFGQCSGAAFDEVCTTNDNCTDSHTECAGSKKCACVAGFTKITSGCKADLGTACNTTADCDTTTTTTSVCDVLVTPYVCKIKSTGNCSVNAAMCVSNAVCTNNVCVCPTKYKEHPTDKLCATVLGFACSTVVDCNTTVANSNCTDSGSKTCTCNTGYTKQGADCKGDSGGGSGAEGLINMMSFALTLTSVFAVKIF